MVLILLIFVAACTGVCVGIMADVSVVSNGVAITVTVTTDPVNTKTTVSEIVLPSFERMAETYVIKAY